MFVLNYLYLLDFTRIGFRPAKKNSRSDGKIESDSMDGKFRNKIKETPVVLFNHCHAERGRNSFTLIFNNSSWEAISKPYSFNFVTTF